ncbi:MAG: hypothetical protein J6Q27_04340, partial [Clostridia bacterium]|nr:hypothetical protein [Clostridia bacterium]
GNEDTYLTNATSKMTDEQIEIDGVLYDTPGYIYATSLGRSVIYYLRSDGSDGKEISYIEENDALNNVVKIDARDILPGKSTNSRIYYEDQDEKECHVDFAGAVDVIFNGRLFRGYGHILNALPTAGYIETVDNDGDKLVDVMFVYEYRNVLISAIDTHKQEIITSTGERILCDIEGGNARLYFASETLPSPLIHVEQDCIASVMESKGTPRLVTVYISEDTIDGTISEVLSDGTVIIDGVKYKKAVDYAGIALVAGESVSLKLDFNGQIAYGDYGAGGPDLERCVLTALDYEQGYFENRVAIRVFKKSKTFEEIPLNETVTINHVRYDLKNATDMENVLKVLSENQKENGYYAVTEARIISCEFDGDKITHINTGTSGTRGGNTQLLENRAKNVLCNSSPQVFTITKEAGGNIYGVYNKSFIDVFAAPYNDPSTPENELMGTDGYAYGITLTQTNYTQKTGTDFTYTMNTALYYEPSDDGINNVTAVLFRGSAKATTATNGVDIESKFYLVSKVTSAIDEDGLTCKKLYFGTDGRLLSDTLSVHDKTGIHTNLSQTDPLVTRIDAGYVIQYGLNAEGKINSIRIASDFDKTTGAVSNQYNWGDFPKGTKYASGVVLENSTAARTITIDAWNTSEGNLFGRVGGTIYIYHSADGELVQATQSEIRIGDKITAHIKTYHTFSEIFIIR